METDTMQLHQGFNRQFISGTDSLQCDQSSILVVLYITLYTNGYHASSSVFRNIWSKVAPGVTDDSRHGTMTPWPLSFPSRMSIPMFGQQCLNPHLSTNPTQSTMSAHETSTGSSTQQNRFQPAVCFATSLLNLHISIVGTQPESPLVHMARLPSYKVQMERGEAEMRKYCTWITSLLLPTVTEPFSYPCN